MSALTDLFGDTPRARLVEALVRLGPRDFTRGEIAREASVFRASANRAIKTLERDRLLVMTRRGARPRFRANPTSTKLRAVAYFVSALRVLDRRGAGLADASQVLDAMRLQLVSSIQAAVPDVPLGSPSVFEVPVSGRPQTLRRPSLGENLAAGSATVG